MAIANFRSAEGFHRVLGRGNTAVVYEVAKRVAAKVLHDGGLVTAIFGGSSHEEISLKEFCVAQDLRRNGVLIPKPLGVFMMEIREEPLDGESGREECGERECEVRIRPAYLARVIDGLMLHQVPSAYSDDAKKKWGVQVRRAMGLGYDSIDITAPKNAMWCPYNKQVYLIDFNRLTK